MIEIDQLPNDIDAERSILGAILLERRPNCILQAIESIRVEDFQLHSHRCIFQQMLLLAEKNEPIDGITLAAMLRATDGLERIGGMTYLASLVDGVPQTDDIGPYIRILRRKSEARRLIKVGQHIMRVALEEPDRDDLIPHCQRLFYEACERYERSPFIHIAEAAKEWLEEVEQSQGGPACGGLLSGLEAIDRPLAGLQRGEMVVIAGRPSQGKTTLSLDLARRLGQRDRRVAYFSLEMGRRKLGERSIAAQGHIDTFEFRTGAQYQTHLWKKDKWSQAVDAMHALESCGVWVVDVAQLSAALIHAKAQRFRREQGGLDVLIVDYLGLMDFPLRGFEKRYEAVGDTARRMKQLARELDCAVVLVHQLNREIEKTKQPEPKLSHLADSGDIEKHADVVIFVYRVPNSKEEDKTFIKIAKHRNGPTAITEVCYVRHEHRFENLLG